ncbi:MAG: YraN family protein [Ruminococcus sp.]|jgi:putative endonuclease|nr:YraN family protein [Ruminococcus sp.]
MSYERDLGNLGETIVANALQRRGVRILERNFTVRGGEIDIIAEKDGILCFIEVKTRSARSERFAQAKEYVNRTKQKRIIKAAKYYLYRTKSDLQPRFDVCEVVIEGGKLIKFCYTADAFGV